ncbi:MAG: hypothetical protein AAGG53_18120 [Cyanobacteria bacterium P01_H01_bin.152]
MTRPSMRQGLTIGQECANWQCGAAVTLTGDREISEYDCHFRGGLLILESRMISLSPANRSLRKA